MFVLGFEKKAILFWLLVLAELAGTTLNIQWVHYTVKPLLMPALLLLLTQSSINAPGKKMIGAGLVFSWFGDVFLLFEGSDPLYFICGLASFLLTHICYIVYFLSRRGKTVSGLSKNPIIILLVIAYGAGLFIFLFPHLASLKIPVLIYAVVICTMLLCSVNIYPKVNAPSNKLYLAGALLFVLSDSLLAINKFYHPVWFGHTLIMLTYCLAQYAIVSGYIKEHRVSIQ